MESIAVVLNEAYDLPRDARVIELRVALPKDVVCAQTTLDRSIEMLRAPMPKAYAIRELARRISAHIEDQILDALTRTGVV